MRSFAPRWLLSHDGQLVFKVDFQLEQRNLSVNSEDKVFCLKNGYRALQNKNHHMTILHRFNTVFSNNIPIVQKLSQKIKIVYTQYYQIMSTRSCKQYQFYQRLSTILNRFCEGTLLCDGSRVRHRGNPTRMWDSSSVFCQGKNINRATVHILTVWQNTVHLGACWCHLNTTESCFYRIKRLPLPYFQQTRTQCPLKCAAGTLTNVQQSNSRFTAQGSLS